jgi:tripartite-type tricarboxylate transporter receptor subunit TctC
MLMVVLRFWLTLIAISPLTALSQAYPTKPIRMVTPGTGGGADFVARLLSSALVGEFGYSVIVDNRANGIMPGQIVSRAAPDGYTLLLASSPLWTAPLLDKTPYDPIKDFAAVSFIANSPHVLVVTPSLPVRTVKDLIALAKAKPGELNYAAASTGSSTHLAAELFKSMAHIDIVRIPYNAGTLQVADVIAGRVELTFGITGAVTPHIKAGRLRALAVTSPQPSALFPDLPTVASTVPGFESGSVYGLFSPSQTPLPIVDRLQKAVRKVLQNTEIRAKFLNSGLEVVGSTPQELAEKVKREMNQLSKVIRDAGIKAD